MAIRFLAQQSSEDIVHILAGRPISQWAMCGEKVGHDWLVRQEDVDLSSSMLDFCGGCRRTLYRELRDESREFVVEERKNESAKTLWERLRAPFVDAEPEKKPEQLP